MRIRLWRGFHDHELLALLDQTWNARDRNELLILCPPLLTDFTFLDLLPEGELEWYGDLKAQTRKSAGQGYPASPVLGVFTSGTTGGAPRLVLYTRENILASVEGVRKCFDARRVSTIFCYPQPFHTFGLTLGYVQALVYGLKLVTGVGRYNSDFHPRRAAVADPGTLTLGTPTHFHDLLAWREISTRTLSPTYSCIIGGARVPAKLWQQVREELAIEAPSIGYGATEASPGLTHLSAGIAPQEDGEIGFALPGVSLQIHPIEGVHFQGANLCLAIIQGTELHFPSTLLLRDHLVQRAGDGVLLYRGRTDLMLNRGGAKFSLELLEDTLLKQLGAISVCVPLPDERLGEELGLLLKSTPERVSELSALKRCLHEHFGLTLQPENISIREQLPLNANGKTDRLRSAEIVAAEKRAPRG